MNPTAEKFGDPETRIKLYDHWVVLLRPEQVTLGSLVLICTEPVQQFSALSKEAFIELREAVNDVERALNRLFQYNKLNYLMLMMVDPDVHFHVFPRYSSNRNIDNHKFIDFGWPGPPVLDKVNKTPARINILIRNKIKDNWSN